MIVADVMTRNPLFIHPEMSVHDARAYLKKEKIGRLIVLDKKNGLVGIVTERDLVNASPSGATTLDIYEMSNLLSKLKVESVMQKKVITIEENVVIEEAARIMVDNSISALPVMKGETLVGIVSDGDLFRLFIDLFGARKAGIRLTMLLPDRTGELSDISHVIAEKGGNVISLVICSGRDVSNRTCILKVSDIDRDVLLATVKPFALEIIDVR